MTTIQIAYKLFVRYFDGCLTVFNLSVYFVLFIKLNGSLSICYNLWGYKAIKDQSRSHALYTTTSDDNDGHKWNVGLATREQFI